MFKTLRRFLRLGSRKITERHTRRYRRGGGPEQSKVALVQQLNKQQRAKAASVSSPKGTSSPKFKTVYNAPKGLIIKRGGRSTLRKH